MTIERKQYVPVDDVLSELLEKLRREPKPDYVTLSGSGEPTLHKDIGRVIEEVKRMTTVPVAVLTNGSLLWQEEVRHALLEADVVIPSLDAGDAHHFEVVNRPDPGIPFDQMVEGLERFRRCFKNQIWLEVFLIGGITALEPEVRKIASLAGRIAPDRIQLNTVSRPPAEEYACPVPDEVMQQLAPLFEPCAQVIAGIDLPPDTSHEQATDDDILSLLARRPCTVKDVADGLRIPPAEVLKHLGRLDRQGSICSVRQGGRNYYVQSSSGRAVP
jgi:wyosine [tRNA(Phe)-imidazoG37] synthetase (radical SAM superfamily)